VAGHAVMGYCPLSSTSLVMRLTLESMDVGIML